MNALSWLIYAGEVVGNLKVLMGLTIAVGSGGILFAALLAGHNSDFGSGNPGDWKKPLRFGWVLFVLAILIAVTPSAKTIYLIAASEAGETIVTSPDTIEMMGDLKAIIKQRLKDELGTSKSPD